MSLLKPIVTDSEIPALPARPNGVAGRANRESIFVLKIWLLGNKKMRIREQRKREKMKELQRMADRVCSLILISDYPEIDIEIERSKVRERCEELYPDRMDLYEMIYESRFDRLWEQFRVCNE